MSSIENAINPILESLGPEVISPNFSQVGEKLYRIFNEAENDYELLCRLKLNFLKVWAIW
jgi:hypothetical protein